MGKADKIRFSRRRKRKGPTLWQQRMMAFKKRATRSRRRKEIAFESRRRNRHA